MKTCFWLTILIIACLGSTVSGASGKSKHPTPAQLESLRQYVYPIRTVVPDGGDDSDLEVLKTVLGKTSIIGLGEATHGTREIFQLKDRIIRYLAENMDFDVFSIEDQFSEAMEVNRYILRADTVWNKGIRQGFFVTEETREMVEWMRRYNDGQQKIRYTGFDMQTFHGAMQELELFFLPTVFAVNGWKNCNKYSAKSSGSVIPDS